MKNFELLCQKQKINVARKILVQFVPSSNTSEQNARDRSNLSIRKNWKFSTNGEIVWCGD